MSEYNPKEIPTEKVTDTRAFSFWGFILKIVLILIITIVGGAITCGGNFLIANFYDEYDALFIAWGIEIVIIFFWAIWLLFFQRTPWQSKTRKIKIITILTPIFSIPIAIICLYILNYLLL